MNKPPIPQPEQQQWLGVTYCLLSAVCYSGANICLRGLAEIDADPAWVICLKETVSVVILGPWLLWSLWMGSRPAVHPRALLILLLTALATQLIGNLGMQWALGIIGLVITLPMVFGALLIGSAIIGVTILHESLSGRSLVAIAAVVMSIVLLSTGATEASDSSAESAGLAQSGLAILAAGCTGLAFAGLGAAMRYAALKRVPVPITVFVVTGTGTLALGAVSLVRLGPVEMLNTERTFLVWVLAAGLCNVMAFSLLNKGIHITTLVHANVLNASQVALGALAGILLFHEPFNFWLAGGVLLTIVGIGFFGKSKHDDAHVEEGKFTPETDG